MADFFPNVYFAASYFAPGYWQTSAALVQPPDEDTSGKGGWDPYYYKRRNKRREKRKDVERFIEEVAQAPLAQAPEIVQAQAQEALEAARLALQLAELEALQRALKEINEFYALVRAEAKRLREEADAEDDELLLLAA